MCLSPSVVAELDCLASSRGVANAQPAVLGEIASDSYSLAAMGAEFLRAAARVVDRYRDRVALTDAPLRHFRAG